MIDKNREIKVTNRTHATVGYEIPELGNLHRSFQFGESKNITFGELEKLSWLPGGRYLLANCLVINDKEVVKELLNDVEPEYYYDDFAVKQLLEYGSVDQLLDCLDFAPDGVLDLVKEYAVELPCNDVLKRQAILEKLNFDVTQAIELAKEAKQNATTNVNSGRRAAPIVEIAEPQAEEDPALAQPEPKQRRSSYVIKK